MVGVIIIFLLMRLEIDDVFKGEYPHFNKS